MAEGETWIDGGAGNGDHADPRSAGLLGAVFIAVLRTYQLLISPWLGAQCRFAPSCSQYAIDAIWRNGAARGSWLAARRLSRCHPFHEGGYDPAP